MAAKRIYDASASDASKKKKNNNKKPQKNYNKGKKVNYYKVFCNKHQQVKSTVFLSMSIPECKTPLGQGVNFKL